MGHNSNGSLCTYYNLFFVANFRKIEYVSIGKLNEVHAKKTNILSLNL